MPSDESGYRKIVESFEVPKRPGATRDEKRKAIVTEVERILNLGGVDRLLVVSKGPSIQVERFVLNDGIPSPPMEVADDLYAASRNAPVEDVAVALNATALETFFRACALLTQKRLKPKALLVKSKHDLRRALVVDQFFPLDEVNCVPVQENAALPSETALLCASPDDGTFELVTLSVRIPLDPPAPAPAAAPSKKGKKS